MFSAILKRQYIIVIIAVVLFELTLLAFVDQPFSYWFEYWWMFPIAVVIALSVNTVGISGAALFVPFFILVFPIFSGTALLPVDTVRLGLITESFGLSSSALAFLAFGLIDGRIARHAILRAAPFVVAGAIFTAFIPQAILYIVIAVLLLFAALLIRYKGTLLARQKHELANQHIEYTSDDPNALSVTRTSRDGKQYSYCLTKRGARRRVFGYSFGGFFQGAAGFGIGELGIISMILTKIPTRIAIGTSHTIVAMTAIGASLLHFTFAGDLPADYIFPWNIPALTVPAVILGGQLAPFVAAKLPTKLLEHFVSVLFVIIAVALALLAFN